jgi:hypothetical protein
MRQPQGAAELIQLRMAGKRPVRDVVVTDSDVIAMLNGNAGAFALIAGPGAWDFRCLHGLYVVVWCLSEAWVIDGDQLGLIESVAQAEPLELVVMSWEATKAFPAEFRRAT